MEIRVFGSTTVLVVMMYRFGFINFICGIQFGCRPNLSIQTDKIIVCILCGTINCIQFKLLLLLLLLFADGDPNIWLCWLIHLLLHRENRQAALALCWIIKRQPANGKRSLNCCVALSRWVRTRLLYVCKYMFFVWFVLALFDLTRSNLFFWCYFFSLSYVEMLFSWVFVFLSLFSRYFCITPYLSLLVILLRASLSFVCLLRCTEFGLISAHFAQCCRCLSSCFLFVFSHFLSLFIFLFSFLCL